ncbi:jg2228 [Pararge aegeria aegeria]|uniref:Jg2228 protein n=1 Tax=Pararge aegeria aegeria TaxID=348720 RepID=A0A8S4SNX0_9NEOP|nr:jg2228 [Pararge aegeria aegeria]
MGSYLTNDRPYSESDIERQPPPVQQCRRSASSPPLTLTFDSDLEDDVFLPRSDPGNDRFSTTNLEIFRYGRTPAGVLLSPRRERSFNFSVTSEKHWRDKGGTDVADGVMDADVLRRLRLANSDLVPSSSSASLVRVSSSAVLVLRSPLSDQKVSCSNHVGVHYTGAMVIHSTVSIGRSSSERVIVLGDRCPDNSFFGWTFADTHLRGCYGVTGEVRRARKLAMRRAPGLNDIGGESGRRRPEGASCEDLGSVRR